MAGTFGLARPDAILSLLSQLAVSAAGETSTISTACLELEEIREADLGRSKTYVKDGASTVSGRFINAVQVNKIGNSDPSRNAHGQSFTLPALCHVDLFRVPDADGQQDTFVSRMPPQAPNLGPPSGVADVNARSTFYPGQNEDAVPSSNSPSLRGGAQIVNSTHALLDNDVIAWFGSFPIRESSRCTDMLSGATFTQAESGEHHGRPATMFIFSDLAVQSEGTFVLRYRVAEMDVHPSQPLLFSTVAECYGEPFKVSSAGEHSGRRASESNPVAQHLALHGISVKTLQDEPHECEGSGLNAPPAARTVSTPKGPFRSSAEPFAAACISSRL